MAAPKLIEFIKKSLKDGIDETRIKAQLLQKGWPKEEVDSALELARSPEKQITETPANLPKNNPGTESTDIIYCQRCRKPNPKNGSFCQECGASLTATLSLARGEYGKKNNSKRMLLLLLILFWPAGIIYYFVNMDLIKEAKEENQLLNHPFITWLVVIPVVTVFIILVLWGLIQPSGDSFREQMRAQTEENTNRQMTCAVDVVFNIKSVKKTNKGYDVLIANDGNEKIWEWNFRLYKSDEEISQERVTSNAAEIEPFSQKTVPVPLTPNTGDIKKIEAIPTIKWSDGKPVVCPTNVDTYGTTDGDYIT